MTQDEMIAMLATIGVAPHERCPVDWTGYVIVFQRFAELVAAQEREACAQVCEGFKQGNSATYIDDDWADMCAAAIRARGQKGGV